MFSFSKKNAKAATATAAKSADTRKSAENSTPKAKERTHAKITECYNLIILDKSGSMESIRSATVAGINETIGSIRAAQTKTGIPQLVSLVAFCGCGISPVYLNRPVDLVRFLTMHDYRPCCVTPLYDAIGTCCTRLKENVGARKDVLVSVTIITDGYENASTQFSAAAIRSLITMLKADGWMIAYIGANQDVDKVKYDLSIDNTLSFEANDASVKKMFSKERRARERRFDLAMSSDKPAPTTGYFDGLDDN